MTGWIGPKYCVKCGAKFWPKRGDAMYCSQACKQRAYRCHHRTEVQKQRCAQCGKLYRPERADQKYCSGACRQRAYRARRSAAHR